MNRIEASRSFLNALSKLEDDEQDLVVNCLSGYMRNPESPGLNLELLEGTDGFYSIRANGEIRLIFCRSPRKTPLFVYVDHHNAAYRWAKRRKRKRNPISESIELYIPKASDASMRRASTQPLSPFQDALLRLTLTGVGVPEDLLESILGLQTREDFESERENLPADAADCISWILDGEPLCDVFDLLRPPGSPLGVADDDRQSDIVIIDTEEELRDVLSKPLEQWRIFLHPRQRELAYGHYRGPERVLGGAGTGKTVIAMHRAKHLAEQTPEEQDVNILFTAFSTTLIDDIESNLAMICSSEELAHIEVVNLDRWVFRFVAEQGLDFSIDYDNAQRNKTKKLSAIWKEAISQGDAELGYDLNFYKEEWEQVILANDIRTCEEYVSVKRIGRGSNVQPPVRARIWHVFEAYQQLMEQEKVRDIGSAMREVRLVFEKDPDSHDRYRHVIVDEGQDFSPQAYRLIRAITEQGDDDIFIVGDAHQRIYSNKAVLSHCGIDVRGRATVLRLNYRTTQEIWRFANAILGEVHFDDLNGSVLPEQTIESRTHGSRPKLRRFKDIDGEIAAISEWIHSLIDHTGNSDEEIRDKDICVVLRSNKLVSEYKKLLGKTEQAREEQGRSHFDIVKLNNRDGDDRTEDGVRISSMHRVKGLEFKCVVLAGACEGQLPPAIEGQEIRQEERNLVYVALTRAMQKVLITSPGKPSRIFDGVDIEQQGAVDNTCDIP